MSAEPSAALVFIDSRAMRPPAPALLSTINFGAKSFICSASRRAIVSAAPPAGKPTTSRADWVIVWAKAGAPPAANVAMRPACPATNVRRVIIDVSLDPFSAIG